MNWLSNMFGRNSRSRNVALPDSADAVDAVDRAVRWARIWVRGGYLSRDQVVESVLGVADDEGLDPELFDADGLVAHEIAELKSDQMRWPPVTDWDRMDAALEGLDMGGVMTRSDFSCCATCGMEAINAELDRFERSGARARGYVFFSQQDTEEAVEGRGLYFSYGSAVSERESDHAAVGRELVSALEGAGLRPGWNGDLGQRVFLPLGWQRRWSES